MRINNPGSGGTWGDPELPHIPNLMRRIAHLKANGWLDYSVENGVARVTYGRRVRDIAARWGIQLAL